MIPLKDNIPHRTTPFVTIALLAVNVAVFIYEVVLGRNVVEFTYTYGFVPYVWTLPVSFFSKVIPLFTNMFLHAGFAHVAGNMLFLWIFADNVEDAFGHGWFLLFYIACGLAASFAHWIFNIGSQIPAVGASGSIAGVLGAYFILYPHARIRTLIPFIIFWEIVEVPAFVFLGIWFVFQFILGVSSIGTAGAGIAFWAHIGGFAAGILLVKLFLQRKHKHY